MLSVTWSTSCCLSGQLQPCLPRATIRHHNPPPPWVHQPPPCHESSPPGCSSLPLLQVWMNVSLSPWLSDFHTVRFSVSSGWFVFLNCCCPSFGCARRHSMSTYTSILAGSQISYILHHSCTFHIGTDLSRYVLYVLLSKKIYNTNFFWVSEQIN